MVHEFNSLHDFDAVTETECIEHYRDVRWPSGVACVHCGSSSVYELAKPGQYKCSEKECRQKFGVRHGSIFADTKIPLKTWFKAIFLMTSHKKGISSHQLARDLAVTQKTAWFLLHRVRNATMTDEFRRPLMSGEVPVQADETLLGGKEHFKHASKRSKFAQGRGSIYSKTVVIGMIQTGGELRMQKMPSFRRKDVEQIIKRNVRPGTKVHTDEATHYKWMHRMYEHSLVKHRMGEYVAADGTHTNSIEGAFGHFKRAVTGVYHQVSDEHVDRYLGMFSWRWTRRNMGEGERTNDLLKSSRNRQITYKQLITREDPDE